MELAQMEKVEKDPEEIGHEALEARIIEMDARKQVLEYLGEVERRKIWRVLGYKSLADFCRRDLAYDTNAVREILIQLGVVLPAARLVSSDPTVQARIEALLDWRRRKASFHALPAYRIVTNKTVLKIAEDMPRTLEELARVPGIGPRKLQDFGREILGVLRAPHWRGRDASL